MRQDISELYSDLLNERYFRVHHRSGLSIYIFPKKMTTAYALFAAKFGSADRLLENGEISPAGVAHFLEHKLFENEDGSDSFERFSELGADANAYTSFSRTVYLFSATENFEESLRELLHFVTHPSFTEESVERERGIISEEIRQTTDEPYNRAFYKMLQGLYCEHPVREEICGSQESIAQITPDILYRAYRTYYHLSNMVLIVCGDVSKDAVLALADEILPQSTMPPTIPKITVNEPKQACSPLSEIRGQVAKPLFCMGVKDTETSLTPAERVKKDAGMAILSEMLFSPSGELVDGLFQSGQIGGELSADYVATGQFAFFRIVGEADDPKEVYRQICAYLEERKVKGLSKEDFERCRRVEYAEYIKGFDSTEEIAETLLSFVSEQAELFDYADVIRNMEFSDIETLLHEFFRPECFTLSVVYPEEEKEREEVI